MCKITALLIVTAMAVFGQSNGLKHAGRNLTGFKDLIKNNLNNTNFERSKEMFEAYFNTIESFDYLLPKSIVPKKYVITLIPHIESLIFDGDITIYGQTDTDIHNKNIITLNADALNISFVNVLDMANGKNLTVLSSAMLSNLQRFAIKLKEDLIPNSDYELSMKFTGKIRMEYGLYRSTYADKPDSPILMTEFEPVYARTVFPCWDEPKYKASFTIRVAREPNQIALSNMPLNFTSEPDQKEGGKVWDTFEESVNMSTYLVAIVIGEFGALRDEENNITIWMEPGKEEYAEFALNFTKATVDHLEDFTGIKYGLPKLDQFAAPSLAFEAMENWGLIAYVDKYLLLEDEESLREKQDIAYHISHEVAHQWFGNLVTFDWWNNVWLNEGFAEFFQYLVIDSLEPDWRAMETFVVKELQYILGQDATVNSRALYYNVESADEIDGMFDNISYLKGGGIVRMLYHIMTPEIFRKGIKRYFEINSFKSVTDESLWQSFHEIDTSDLDLPADIGEIMHSWIHEPCYPIIQVERNKNDTMLIHSITLTQKQYFKRADYTTFDTDDKKWWVPLSYTTSTELDFEDTTPKEWFNATTNEHNLNIYLEEDEWIILNIQLTGYYRINYDLLTWNLITEDMIDNGANDIHQLNRAALIDDAYNLVFSDYIDIDVFMNLTRYLQQETDMIPWSTAFTVFKDLNSNLEGSPAQPLLHRYIQRLISCWYAEIGCSEGENDTVSTKLSRTLLLDVACSFGHRECQAKALEHVYLMMSEADRRLPTNLEEIHLCVAVSKGSSEVWQYVRKRYIESRSKSSRESLLDSMACSNDPSIIKQMLRDSIDQDSFLLKTDGSYLIGALLTEIGVEHIDLVLHFFSDNLKELLRLHGEEKVSSYFLRMAVKLNKNSSKVNKFIEAHRFKLGDIFSSLRKKLNYVDYYHNKLKDEYHNKIYKWLKREEVNFEKDISDDYEATDMDDIETTTINEETTENFIGEVTEFDTTEEEIDFVTSTEGPRENILDKIKNNVTDVLEEGINNVIETATEVIHQKPLPKIPVKDSENSVSPNTGNSSASFLMNFFQVLVSFLIIVVIV